ncbi:MAG: hypothetical protein H6667_08945 [Ardenticatenaceae bacterium]|nr:hypothetical protein [Ardenticatenaceae bacterium]
MTTLILSQCTVAPTATATSTAPAALQSTNNYTDPFAYCAAVGTIDTPGSDYTGPQTPMSIIDGLKQAANLSADMPNTIIESGTFWRCMNGRVWACFVGANLPCSEKADTSQTPTQPMTDFCQANTAADAIPAAVTGRATVYEWRCTDGSPTVVKQLFQPDSQGFISDFWYEINTNANAPNAPALP